MKLRVFGNILNILEHVQHIYKNAFYAFLEASRQKQQFMYIDIRMYVHIHMYTSVSSNRVKMRNAVVMLTLVGTFTCPHNI